MKVRNWRFFAALALSLVLAFALVGCGEKEPAGDAGSGDVSTYTIGIASPLTQGAVAIGQGIKRGAELAIAEYNAKPEVKEAGIQFKTVDGDDMGDPKTAVNVANNFASDKTLIGLVGHFNSGCSIPASKVYNDASIVMVSPGSTNPQLTEQGFPFVFRTCATDALQGPEGATYAGAMGYKKFVVIDDSTPYGEGLATEFSKKVEADGGEILLTEKTSDKDTDFNALVTKIKAKNPDMVYYAGMYMAGALFAKQLHDAGVTAPVIGGDGMYDAQYIELGGKSVEGDYTTCVGLPADKLPAAADFQAAYEAKYPGEAIGAFDAYAYDAAAAIIMAAIEVAKAEGADKLNSPAGRDALQKAVAAVNFEGVTGPVSFDAKGDTNNKVVSLYKVESGAWVWQDPTALKPAE